MASLQKEYVCKICFVSNLKQIARNGFGIPGMSFNHFCAFFSISTSSFSTAIHFIQISLSLVLLQIEQKYPLYLVRKDILDKTAALNESGTFQYIDKIISK